MLDKKVEEDVFSNPIAPSSGAISVDESDQGPHPMTNADFRKLLMTPKAPARQQKKTEAGGTGVDITISTKDEAEDEDDPATRRRKKKSYYAKLKKMEEEREQELRRMYRDRAQERREGTNKDYTESSDIVSTTADYRAVAPNAKIDDHYHERRKQLIQESKYLGGDMEHTHLVKGLDYALLEKVRAEICLKETEDDEDLDNALKELNKEAEDVPEVQMNFKSKMARNIFRTVFITRAPLHNELFLPRRMAYQFDIEEAYSETDIPCTIIRSKADCPTLEATTTLTTNDIVINKLTQILSYLRQGRRDAKKLKKKDKGKNKDDLKTINADEGIYLDATEYIPNYQKKDKQRKESNKRDDKKRYFEKPVDEDEDILKPTKNADILIDSINEKFAKGWAPADIEREANLGGPDAEASKKIPTKEEERQKKIQFLTVDSYAECYPGMMESVLDDSDDEVDYTKMDQGNKKGPIGRWDFDTTEEYSDYMSHKEALPKAAFQYGVKMADGRKTRRTGPKDEKRALDKEWQQITNLINKRKETGMGGGPLPKESRSDY